MRIAVTGSNGLIGSRLTTLLQPSHEIIPLNSSDGIDITIPEQVHEYLESHKPDVIVHLAGKTNVDACEKDEEHDKYKISTVGTNSVEEYYKEIDPSMWKEDNGAYAVNVVGTFNIIQYAKKHAIPFYYISSDFVFEGVKDYYEEEDARNPVNWYGMTKMWGEKLAEELLENACIIRPAYPYGYYNDVKKDLVWKILELFDQHDKFTLVNDQIITPTFIDDIVEGTVFLVENHQRGKFHVVGESFLSPYEIGIKIAEVFGKNPESIGAISGEEFFKGRAKRPFKVRLKNDKLKSVGFTTKSFDQGLSLIKNTL